MQAEHVAQNQNQQQGGNYDGDNTPLLMVPVNQHQQVVNVQSKTSLEEATPTTRISS